MLNTTLNCARSFFTSAPARDLVGRNYIKPKDFSTDDIKSVLWTASDVKRIFRQDQEVNNIASSKITLLMHKPSTEIQASITSAANLLNAHLNVIIDPLWDKQDFTDDIGRFLSTCSDMVFCQSQYQSKIEKLAQGSAIPVVGVLSCTYAMPNALADLLTVQEKYRHLKNLSIAWLGRPCPLFNTYLHILPQLNINLRYHCACKASGEHMSPAALPVGKELSKQKHTKLVECDEMESAIDKVHTIIMAKHDVKHFQLNLKKVEENADKHWSLIHHMPRGDMEITPEVFNHKNSLVWEAKGNLQFIYAALMLRLLRTYKHVNEQPDF